MAAHTGFDPFRVPCSSRAKGSEHCTSGCLSVTTFPTFTGPPKTVSRGGNFYRLQSPPSTPDEAVPAPASAPSQDILRMRIISQPWTALTRMPASTRPAKGRARIREFGTVDCDHADI